MSPYNPDYEPIELPIVNAALLYECKTTGESSIIMVKNALLVDSMRVNLIPPFIMRENGINVKDTPKIHIDDPTPDNHAITITRPAATQSVDFIFSF